MKMETKTMWQKFRVNALMLAGLFTALSLLSGVAAWLFQDKIDDYIMYVVETNKGESTKAMLAEEMSTSEHIVKKEDVCEELGEMYLESMHQHDQQNAILDIWIPYLKQETQWRIVGYFVNIEDPDIVKFHHWDGRNYDAWKDDQGWFYIKGGYKYYH